MDQITRGCSDDRDLLITPCAGSAVRKLKCQHRRSAPKLVPNRVKRRS